MLTGGIYGRPSIRFVLCHLNWTKRCSPLTILVSNWVKLNRILKLEGTMNCFFGVWEIMCKISIFEPTVHMAAKGSSSLWLANYKNKIFSKINWPNLLKFRRKHLWNVLHKVSSKQNDGCATQAQLTEPLLSLNMKTKQSVSPEDSVVCTNVEYYSNLASFEITIDCGCCFTSTSISAISLVFLILTSICL